MSQNQMTSWRRADQSHQFGLRSLFEILAVCSVIFAGLRFHDLIASTLTFGLATAWAIRVRDWRFRVPLMMMFGGFCAVSLGVFFVVGAFQLEPQILWTDSLLDALVITGMFVAISGAFYGLFGLYQLIVALISALVARSTSEAARARSPQAGGRSGIDARHR